MGGNPEAFAAGTGKKVAAGTGKKVTEGRKKLVWNLLRYEEKETQFHSEEALR
jgi:hypothetical protein